MLSDRDLREAFAAGELSVTRPLGSVNPEDFRGASLDLHLASEYYRCGRPHVWSRRRTLDLARVQEKHLKEAFPFDSATINGGMRIQPGEFILGRTEEHIELSASLSGLLTGRTSYSRVGLAVEVSQNLLQPGHSNPVPLQIVNHSAYPIMLYPGTPICQLSLFRLTSSAEVPYRDDRRAKYRNTTEMRSKVYRDDTVPVRERPDAQTL